MRPSTSLRHPTDGVLRRLLDEPAGVSDADRSHVAECDTCLSTLAVMHDDATAVGAALRPAAPRVDVDAGWNRLSASLAAHSPARVAAPPRPARRRAALRRPLVAGLGAAVLLAGGGVAAANDWLPIFRTEQIAAVDVNPAELVQVPDLTAYGDVELTGDGNFREVPDAAAAESQTGIDVPVVSGLPEGVDGDPSVQVVDQLSATFTFSAEKAAEAAAGTGEALPEPPPGLDGSSVRIDAGPGVAQVWSRAEGVPTLVVARATAPTAFSDSVPFETVRDYLLSLPGLPQEVADQLRSVSADGSTLPLPVPADLVETESADVDGHEATVLTSRDGLLAAVVWVDDGVVTAVAGSLSADEVLSLARELR